MSTVIYFVATRPYVVKALGDTFYHTPDDAQAVADFWQPLGPFKVWQALVTDVEAVSPSPEFAAPAVEALEY